MWQVRPGPYRKLLDQAWIDQSKLAKLASHIIGSFIVRYPRRQERNITTKKGDLKTELYKHNTIADVTLTNICRKTNYFDDFVQYILCLFSASAAGGGGGGGGGGGAETPLLDLSGMLVVTFRG